MVARVNSSPESDAKQSCGGPQIPALQTRISIGPVHFKMNSLIEFRFARSREYAVELLPNDSCAKRPAVWFRQPIF